MQMACDFAIIDAQKSGQPASDFHELKALTNTYITTLVPISAHPQEKQTAEATFAQTAMQLLGAEARLDPSTKHVSSAVRHRAINIMLQSIHSHVQCITKEVAP
jgi:hypothetical protein